MQAFLATLLHFRGRADKLRARSAAAFGDDLVIPTSIASPRDCGSGGSAARIAERGGRATRTRVAVLDILSRAGRPLAHDEVAAALAAAAVEHDRVTLYRTLDWLVTHALAHRVAGTDRVWRFSAAVDEAHGHAHFHCAGCGAMFCMEALQPAIAATLPCGFECERAELTFHGRCPSCH